MFGQNMGWFWKFCKTTFRVCFLALKYWFCEILNKIGFVAFALVQDPHNDSKTQTYRHFLGFGNLKTDTYTLQSHQYRFFYGQNTFSIHSRPIGERIRRKKEGEGNGKEGEEEDERIWNMEE